MSIIKSYSFRRQFRRQFLTVFPCSFAGTIGWYYGNFPVNLAKFDYLLQTLLMSLCEIWLTIIKSYSFRRQFRRQFSTVSHVVCRQHRLLLRQLPCTFVRSLINVNFAKFDLLLQKLLKRLLRNLIEYY